MNCSDLRSDLRVVGSGRLDSHQRLLILGAHREDRKAVSFSSRLQRVQLFQVLRSHLFEGGGNTSFLNINLFSRQVFQLLDRLSERLETDRLPGREQRGSESWVAGEGCP